MGGIPLSNAAGIFPKANISPMMNAVLDTCPVMADRGVEFSLGILVVVGTGYVVADFIARLVGAAERDAFAAHGDDLPASTKTDLLGCDRQTRQTSAFKPSMVRFPLNGVIRGEKPAV